MTDFAKEARMALALIGISPFDRDAAIQNVASLIKNHRAAGVAEGMAKAAEIARRHVPSAPGYETEWMMRRNGEDIAEAILADSPPPEPQPQLTADQMSALEKAAYDKLPAQEDDGWRSEQEWQALLDGRDKFIVDRGLWSDFVRSL